MTSPLNCDVYCIFTLQRRNCLWYWNVKEKFPQPKQFETLQDSIYDSKENSEANSFVNVIEMENFSIIQETLAK